MLNKRRCPGNKSSWINHRTWNAAKKQRLTLAWWKFANNRKQLDEEQKSGSFLKAKSRGTRFWNLFAPTTPRFQQIAVIQHTLSVSSNYVPQNHRSESTLNCSLFCLTVITGLLLDLCRLALYIKHFYELLSRPTVRSIPRSKSYPLKCQHLLPFW